MKLLVTSGATREPIDEVRFLSNVSSGRTGAQLADSLSQRGHAVTLLAGEAAVRPTATPDVRTFSSAEDLQTKLQKLLSTGAFDGVIMAAAVADYRPAEFTAGKLSSDADGLTIRCVRNPKILPQLKSFSPRPLAVVGFKLTVGADASARYAAVFAQFATGGVDAVVQNDLAEIRAAAADAHPFRLFTAAHTEPQPVAGVSVLALELERILSRLGPHQAGRMSLEGEQ
ncbi:MAG: phosphopantothenoylcysteine decarboxylase [Opitutus sp.]|nr:phosphopantothenoylcysteine decarboxylase [Opitutus sp.]